MPVKARRPKRRADDAAMVAAWSTLFADGYDFFDETGFPTDAAAREAAPEMWARYGRKFLDTLPETTDPAGLWAVQQFGEPDAR